MIQLEFWSQKKPTPSVLRNPTPPKNLQLLVTLQPWSPNSTRVAPTHVLHQHICCTSTTWCVVNETPVQAV